MKTIIMSIIMASIILFILGCLGKEKTPNISEIYPKEEFAVIEAKLNEGKLIVGSINQGYKNYSHKKDYPWCLKIAIGLEIDKLYENGLPLPDESKIAYQLEDELMAEIKNITTAHYIGHIFNDTFLDIYVYLPKPGEVHKYLQTQINKEGLLRGFGYEINRDPNWETVSFLFK